MCRYGWIGIQTQVITQVITSGDDCLWIHPYFSLREYLGVHTYLGDFMLRESYIEWHVVFEHRQPRTKKDVKFWGQDARTILLFGWGDFYLSLPVFDWTLITCHHRSITRAHTDSSYPGFVGFILVQRTGRGRDTPSICIYSLRSNWTDLFYPHFPKVNVIQRKELCPRSREEEISWIRRARKQLYFKH